MLSRRSNGHRSVKSSPPQGSMKVSQPLTGALCVCRGQFPINLTSSVALPEAMPKLVSLMLGACRIEDGASFLSNLQNLTSLDLLTMSMSYSQMLAFTSLTQLKQLAVPSNMLASETLSAVGSLVTLQELNVAGCPNAALNQPKIDFLTGLTCLTALQVCLQNVRWDQNLQVRQGIDFPQQVSDSLQALARLPLEILRIWEYCFLGRSRFKNLVVAPGYSTMSSGMLARALNASAPSECFHVPKSIQRAMVQASQFHQEYRWPDNGAFFLPLA